MRLYPSIKTIIEITEPKTAFMMRISPSAIPGKETSIDRCNANIETQLSASERLRKAMSFEEFPFLRRARFMIEKVIFVKVYAAIVIITIICMTLPHEKEKLNNNLG